MKLINLTNEKSILDDLKEIYSKFKDTYIYNKTTEEEPDLPQCLTISEKNNQKENV